MFLKKVLNQPNLVGTMLIALMVCAGFVYAFAFDGFNVETATGGEVEAWLAAAGGGSSGGSGGGQGDPPEDRQEGAIGTDPCDCYKNLAQNMHTHADCSCGNKIWKIPRKSGKFKNGGWANPCDGLKVYPCGKGKKGVSTCKGRNKHQQSGVSHCPCPPHPINSGTGTWNVCKSSSNTKCNDGCWQGVKR